MIGKMKRALLRVFPTTVAGRLRAFRIRRQIDSFNPRVVEHLYGSERLQVILLDPLAQGWYDHDWKPLPEIAALRKSRLRPGARVFDFGAHQGVVAMILAREVGLTGQVIAIEANAHNCSAAIKNRELNGLDQIEVINAAVSNRSGKLIFSAGLNGQIDDGTGRGGQVEVEAITVDGLSKRFGVPDVVFIDVEGAEVLALEGATSTLNGNSDFFVEVHVGHGLELLGGSVKRVLSFFPEDQFSVLGQAEGEESFRSLSENDPLFNARFFLLALRKT
jgi:FkbM family methyltransferase